MGEREGIVIDFELIKINDRKFHSLYTISNLEAFFDVLGDRGNYFESGNAESLAHEMEKVILRYDDELIKSNTILRELVNSPSEFDINLFLSRLIT